MTDFATQAPAEPTAEELRAALEVQRLTFARGAPDYKRRMDALAALRDGVRAHEDDLVAAIAEDSCGPIHEPDRDPAFAKLAIADLPKPERDVRGEQHGLGEEEEPRLVAESFLHVRPQFTAQLGKPLFELGVERAKFSSFISRISDL